MATHPPRLDKSLYIGVRRYFLTICCDRRRPLFTDPAARELVLTQLRSTSNAHAFAIIVYCLMPDHVHLVMEGKADSCDLLEFVRLFKQGTAYTWKQRTRDSLWQPSFHDHILRDGEATQDVVRYVLENPVRAGLVAAPQDYEHSGSFVYDRDDLIEWAFGWNRAEQ
jgi:REP element-mobilizing transposase RayT